MLNEQNTDFVSKIKNLTDRELLFLRLACNKELGFTIEEMSANCVKETILRLNKHENEILVCLKNIFKKYFVPEENFEWLEGNLRAQLFTLVYVRWRNVASIHFKNKYEEVDVFGYLYPPSYADININKKGFVIEQIYKLFDEYQIGVDYITKDEKIKIIDKARFLWTSVYDQWDYAYWLEGNNEIQMRWAKNYLIKNNLYIDNINGVNSEQQYKSIILASLDLMEFKDDILKKSNYKKSSTKEKFINRMKASWDQKKRRDAGEEKKPYHLALTKHTKARLDKMAEINNVKPEKLLEGLINLEYEECYLDKNGEEKFLDCSKFSQ